MKSINYCTRLRLICIRTELLTTISYYNSFLYLYSLKLKRHLYDKNQSNPRWVYYVMPPPPQTIICL